MPPHAPFYKCDSNPNTSSPQRGNHGNSLPSSDSLAFVLIEGVSSPACQQVARPGRAASGVCSRLAGRALAPGSGRSEAAKLQALYRRSAGARPSPARGPPAGFAGIAHVPTLLCLKCLPATMKSTERSVSGGSGHIFKSWWPRGLPPWWPALGIWLLSLVSRVGIGPGARPAAGVPRAPAVADCPLPAVHGPEHRPHPGALPGERREVPPASKVGDMEVWPHFLFLL